MEEKQARRKFYKWLWFGVFILMFIGLIGVFLSTIIEADLDKLMRYDTLNDALRKSNDNIESQLAIKENDVVLSYNLIGNSSYEISLHLVNNNGYTEDLLTIDDGKYVQKFAGKIKSYVRPSYPNTSFKIVPIGATNYVIASVTLLPDSDISAIKDNCNTVFQREFIKNESGFIDVFYLAEVPNITTDYEITIGKNTVFLNKWYNNWNISATIIGHLFLGFLISIIGLVYFRIKYKINR